MSYIIEPARRSDVPAITEIYNHAILHSTALWAVDPVPVQDRYDWYDDLIAAGYPIFVARPTDRFPTEWLPAPLGSTYSGGYEPPKQELEEVPELILGYACFGPFNPKPGYKYTVENSIYLHPSLVTHCRSMGLGSAFLQRLIDETRVQGRKTIVALIAADNVPSIKLHDKFGFQFTGKLSKMGRKFGKWLDLVYMQLVLDDDERDDGYDVTERRQALKGLRVNDRDGMPTNSLSQQSIRAGDDSPDTASLINADFTE